MSLPALLNLALRGGSLLAKFLLLLWMTRHIGLEAVGVYGLLLAAIVVGSKVIGLGLYFVANREMVGRPALEQASIIRDQELTFLPQYFLLFVAGWIVYALYATPSWPAWWMVMVLFIFNHQVVELMQMLIALNRSVQANAVMFMNSGWAYLAIAAGAVWPAARTLDTVLLLWVVGVAAALLLALWFLRDIPLRQAGKQPVNWRWLQQAFWRGWPLYLSVLAQQGSLYVDRYVLQAFVSAELVGVFVMFWSFANAAQILVQTGVLQTMVPVLIQHHKNGDVAGLTAARRHLLQQVLLIGGGLCVLAIFLITPVLHIMNRPLAFAYVPLFWLLLVGFFIRMLADVYFYVLYARHQDQAMWRANVIGLVAATLGNLVCIALWGVWGAAIAQIISAGVILLAEVFMFRRGTGLQTQASDRTIAQLP